MANKKNSSKHPHLTGAFDLFPKSYEVVKRNARTFAILLTFSFIPTLISVLNYGDKKNVSGISNATGFSGMHFYNIAGIVGIGIAVAVLFWLLSTVIQTMLVMLQLEGAKGKTPDLGYLWSKMWYFFPRILGLTVIVAVMTIGGLILLIVPGLIVLRRYYLAPFALVDHDLSIGDAMRYSADISKPHSGYVWSVIGVTVLLALPGVIPVVGSIVAFVLAALYSVAPALRYLELKKLTA